MLKPKLPIAFSPRTPQESARFQKWAMKTYNASWGSVLQRKVINHTKVPTLFVEACNDGSVFLLYSPFSFRQEMHLNYTLVTAAQTYNSNITKYIKGYP